MPLLSRCFFGLMILILVSTGGTAAAQKTPDEPQPLAYGDTVSGTLDDDHFEDIWTFTGQRGIRITLVMERTEDTPGGLDGYMRLLDPDGETLEQIDDTGSNVMPSLIDYELPADGEYTVVATRFGFQNGFSAGSYTLSLSQLSGDAEPTGGGAQWIDENDLPADLRALRYNERSIGTIVDEDFEDWYMFRGSGGDTITIRMAADSSELDSYLILLDTNGIELVSNDDTAGDNHDAAIVDFELPATGNYLIRATRYGYNNGPSSGDYTISIETDAAVSSSSEDTEITQQLAYGGGARGSLDLDNLHDVYDFNGREGQTITIAVRRTSGDLDPALSLRGPSQDEIALNRELGNPSEARIAHLMLPQNGLYTLEVMLENLNSSGEYQVLLLLGTDTVTESDWEPVEETDLEFVLSWETDVDLDLSVTNPAEETISLLYPSGENGGELAASANDFCTPLERDPVELITWETVQPGVYQIDVLYQFNCAGLDDPIPFTLTVINQGEIVAVLTGTLAREGDTYTTTYTAP